MRIILTGNTYFKIANFREGLVRKLISLQHEVSVFAPKDSTSANLMRYFWDGNNAVLVDQAEQAPLALLANPERYRAMSHAARATWENQALYAQDFRAACDQLLERSA